MENYYVSLVKGLQGNYVKFLACNEEVVRDYCLQYMGKMWCSIYTESQINNFKFKCNVINEDKPITLGDSSDWD